MIAGFVQSVDIVTKNSDMMPENVVHERCCGKALTPDFCDDFQNFAFGLRTDIDRCPNIVIRRNEKGAFVIGQDDTLSPPIAGRHTRGCISQVRWC